MRPAPLIPSGAAYPVRRDAVRPRFKYITKQFEKVFNQSEFLPRAPLPLRNAGDVLPELQIKFLLNLPAAAHR